MYAYEALFIDKNGINDTKTGTIDTNKDTITDTSELEIRHLPYIK